MNDEHDHEKQEEKCAVPNCHLTLLWPDRTCWMHTEDDIVNDYEKENEDGRGSHPEIDRAA